MDKGFHCSYRAGDCTDGSIWSFCITTGPDNTNNVLALIFGVLIVCLVVFGSLWIMTNLNHNMIPMKMLMDMQR